MLLKASCGGGNRISFVCVISNRHNASNFCEYNYNYTDNANLDLSFYVESAIAV